MTCVLSVRNEDISEAHMFIIKPNNPGEAAFLELEQKLAKLDWEVQGVPKIIFVSLSLNKKPYFQRLGCVVFVYRQTKSFAQAKS